MKENRLVVLLLIGLIGFNLYQKHNVASPTVAVQHPSGGMLHDIWLKLKKIEALVTLMQEQKSDERTIPVEKEQSVPLRERDLVTMSSVCMVQPIGPQLKPDLSPLQVTAPIVEMGMVQVPRTPIGMEPAKDPPPSQPVQSSKQYFVPAGHYEYRGFRGRRAVWVNDGPQQAYQQDASGIGRRVLSAPVRAGGRILRFCLGGRYG